MMSSHMSTGGSRSSSASRAERRYRRSFFGTVRSEWIKLVSLRSTWWIAAVTVVVNIGICAGIAASLRWAETSLLSEPGAYVPGPDGEPMTEFGPGDLGLLSENVAQSCSMLGQLVFIILAVLIITNEYSSGMIRSTMTVVPRRRMVLTAKVLVLAALAVIVFAVSLVGGWGIAYMILHDSVAVDLTLNSATSWRILGGFVAEMVLIGWMCLGLGTIIRSSAGGIGAAIGVVMVLPMVFQLLTGIFASSGEPTGWRKVLVDIQTFLPTNAGSLVTRADEAASAVLGPWEGLAVLGAWSLVSLVVAYIVISRRDV